MDFAGSAVTAKHVLSFYSWAAVASKRRSAISRRAAIFPADVFCENKHKYTNKMKQIRLAVLMILLMLSMLFAQDWAESITSFIGALSSLLVAIALIIMCVILAITWYSEGKLPGGLYRDENNRA